VQEMVIYGVSFDMVGKQPIVLLKTVENNKFLPIWIGHPEAAAILMKLQVPDRTAAAIKARDARPRHVGARPPPAWQRRSRSPSG